MKKIILLIFVILVSLQLNAQSKIGTIEIEFIVSKMPILTQVEKDLTAYNTELEAQNDQKLIDYQKQFDVYKQNENTYTEAVKKTKQGELIAAENDIKKFQNNAGKLIQIRQDDLMRPLYQLIGDAIEKVAKEESYTQILKIDNTIVYIDQNYDITLKVMTKMGIPLPEQGK